MGGGGQVRERDWAPWVRGRTLPLHRNGSGFWKVLSLQEGGEWRASQVQEAARTEPCQRLCCAEGTRIFHDQSLELGLARDEQSQNFTEKQRSV